MPTGTPLPTDWQLYHDHKAKAQAAYAAYLRIQEKIERFEAIVTQMFPTNDREAAAFLSDPNPDDPRVWTYQARCRLRAVHQTVVAMETSMASLYRL